MRKKSKQIGGYCMTKWYKVSARKQPVFCVNDTTGCLHHRKIHSAVHVIGFLIDL
jgi:hypothetical protein